MLVDSFPVEEPSPARQRAEPNQKDNAMSKSSIRVETRSTDTDGSEVALTRTISNIYDIRWDVKDVNWASVYVHSDTVRVGFGSLGGIDMTHGTAVKVFEDLKTALTNEGLLDAEESVV